MYKYVYARLARVHSAVIFTELQDITISLRCIVSCSVAATFLAAVICTHLGSKGRPFYSFPASLPLLLLLPIFVILINDRLMRRCTDSGRTAETQQLWVGHDGEKSLRERRDAREPRACRRSQAQAASGAFIPGVRALLFFFFFRTSRYRKEERCFSANRFDFADRPIRIN